MRSYMYIHILSSLFQAFTLAYHTFIVQSVNAINLDLWKSAFLHHLNVLTIFYMIRHTYHTNNVCTV